MLPSTAQVVAVFRLVRLQLDCLLEVGMGVLPLAVIGVECPSSCPYARTIRGQLDGLVQIGESLLRLADGAVEPCPRHIRSRPLSKLDCLVCQCERPLHESGHRNSSSRAKRNPLAVADFAPLQFHRLGDVGQALVVIIQTVLDEGTLLIDVPTVGGRL